jgi:glyoxylase-like metal-dependent hydrolase (beta-lactamase superfamily II)
MYIRVALSSICFLVTLASAIDIAGQSRTGVSETSYLRARQVLESGIKALGGNEAFRNTEDISIKFSGQAFEQGQSGNAEAPYFVRREEGTRIIDLRGNSSSFESRTNYRGGDEYWGREVLNDKSSFTIDLTTGVAYPIASSAIASRARSAKRFFPHFLLQEASSRADTLRWLGNGPEGEEVITFVDAGGGQTALYFDRQTKLLTKYESLGDDPIFGDVLRETLFADYREIEGLKIPSRISLRYAGELISDLRYDEIKVNTHPAADVFQIPPDFVRGPETLGLLSPTLTPLAPGVYFVNGMSAGAVWFYSQLVVVFRDYVLVVESPLNNGVSRLVIAKIKEVAAGKPIKYVVPTHYHFDHLGGIRSYIAQGATVVTTPGNKALIEKIFAAPHTFRPDDLSTSGSKAQIEIFRDKKVISDGERSVELYEVGPSPHVDEIVIAYLPKEKLLFVTDLCMTRVTGKIPPRSQTNIEFAEKLRQLNLPVETIANGHGWVGTMSQLQDSLKRN